MTPVTWIRLVLAAGVAVTALSVGCGGSRQSVIRAARAGGGTVRVFDATSEQVWVAARAALLWSHASALEEHRDEGYVLGTAPTTGWSFGGTMGVWIEPATSGRVRVRAVVSRSVETNVTPNEGGLLDDMAKALALEKQGRPIGEDARSAP